MRNKKKLLADFKIKKIKSGVTSQNADVLFGLVVKYLVPLDPDTFNFTMNEEEIEIRSKINDWNISLLLLYKPNAPEDEARFSVSTMKNGGTTGVSGRNRAKKALINIQQIIKKNYI